MSEKKESSFTVVDKRRSGNDSDSDKDTGVTSAPANDNAAGATDDETGAEAPPINFSTFLLSLYSSAAYHMGGYQDPVSGKTSINLELAKQNIDILAIIDEKTRGNLSTEEEQLLQRTLYELRMSYVDACNQASAGGS